MYRADHVFKPLKSHYNFLFSQGGLGDLIARLPTVKFILEQHPQIVMHLWIHDFAKIGRASCRERV